MKNKKKIEQKDPEKWDFRDKMIDGYSPYPSLGAYEYVRSLENIENETEKHHFNEKLEFMKKKEENSNRCTDPYRECALRNEKRECTDPYSRDEYCIDTTETPFFGNNDNFAQAITEAGIKAAKATHEFNMKEIKAKLIADLCTELVKTPMRYTVVPQIAREIAENALKEI